MFFPTGGYLNLSFPSGDLAVICRLHGFKFSLNAIDGFFILVQ